MNIQDWDCVFTKVVNLIMELFKEKNLFAYDVARI